MEDAYRDGDIKRVREMGGGLSIFVLYCRGEKDEWLEGNYYVVLGRKDVKYIGDFSRDRLVIKFGEWEEVRELVERLERGSSIEKYLGVDGSGRYVVGRYWFRVRDCSEGEMRSRIDGRR